MKEIIKWTDYRGHEVELEWRGPGWYTRHADDFQARWRWFCSAQNGQSEAEPLVQYPNVGMLRYTEKPE